MQKAVDLFDSPSDPFLIIFNIVADGKSDTSCYWKEGYASYSYRTKVGLKQVPTYLREQKLGTKKTLGGTMADKKGSHNRWEQWLDNVSFSGTPKAIVTDNKSKADDKLIKSKSHCPSLDGSCGSCECIEDAGVSGALYSSKIDTIVDEYNHLLTSQLENQRLKLEGKEGIIAEAVEQAVNLKLQDFQTRKNVSRKRTSPPTERTTLKLRGEKIQDLEEQIRDITVFIEVQRLLDGMT
ncbi:hypothetical protein QJS10_CPB17g00985 [Acorus calamus]|uniref:Uncharacterized protein n=1 Tax=Acorus calamus TaxID=4465 RepID=A0AAV9CX75_ACOCL|nr:hypothetical protein QJS10_CPB17g00985 [Acorus calamus]